MIGLAERRRSASGRRRMGWSILSVPLEGDGDESSDEDDEAWEHENFDMKPVPAVGDRHRFDFLSLISLIFLSFVA